MPGNWMTCCALLAAALMSAGPAAAHAQTVPSASALDSEFAVVGGDDVSSALLPDGQVLWVYGDTLWAGSDTICSPSACGYGYPHDSFALQASPGAAAITPDTDPSLPYGLQRIPNASDGSFYWPDGAVAASGRVFVFCAHMSADGKTVLGPSLAVFGDDLIFQNMITLPGPDFWSSAVRVSGGWWLGGSSVPGTTRQGDVAFVPAGDWLRPSKWTVHDGVMPAGLDVGATVALHRSAAGWQAWTKLGDAYGSNSVEELTAPAATGPWTRKTTIPAPCPAGTVTYSVMLHPEQPAPAGSILLSYAVNGVFASYHPLFLYVDPPRHRHG
jgi:hypothetical protein